ncbi:MAG: molecular chaperone DnaJ, partial [Methanobacteriota archaeon]
DVAEGVKKRLRIPHLVQCKPCQGTGAEDAKTSTCPKCNGNGQLQDVRRNGFSQFVTIRTCPSCRGSGQYAEKACPECRGSGTKHKTSTLEVDVPKGAFDGLRLKIPGKGEAGERGGPAGDLYVFVHTKPHEIFERRGSDLVLDLPISFAQAALGDKVDIPTLDGKARLTIPPGTQTGTIFKITRKGLPDIDGYVRGDELVRVTVVTPEKMSSEERKIMKRFGETTGDYHNKGKKSIFRKK